MSTLDREFRRSQWRRAAEFAQSRGHTSGEEYIREKISNIERGQKVEEFSRAIAGNDTIRVKRLLEEGITSYSALTDASRNGSESMVRLLLSQNDLQKS